MNKKILIVALIVLSLPGLASAFDLASLGGNITGELQGLATALAVGGFCMAAILYLASTGSPEMAGLAKKALIAAVIGSIIAIGAGAIQSWAGSLAGV